MNDERNNDTNVHIDSVEGRKFKSFGINKDKIRDLFNAYNNRGLEKEKKEGSTNVELFPADYECDLIAELGKEEGIAQKLSVSLSTGLKTDKDERGPVSDRIDRVKEFDDNMEEDDPVPHFCVFIWEALADLMIRILIVAAIVQIILGAIPQIAHSPTEWVDGLSILFAVILVVFVGSFTNYSKEKKFKEMSEETKASKTIPVLRNGKKGVSLHPSQLLVGDIVNVVLGDILQADGILLEGSDLKIDESPLTGESDLIEKETYDKCMAVKNKILAAKPGEIIKGKHTIPSPLLYSGTQVKQGKGVYLILAVGKNSAQGQIQETIKQSQEDNKTPLEQKLDDIAGDIGKFGLAIAIFTLVVLLIRFGVMYPAKVSAYEEYISKHKGENQEDKHPSSSIAGSILSIILLCVTIIVVAIPEGLPLAVTLSLAFAIKKMNDENNLVRTMHACETMGNANYICTDKTGTLTMNMMSVSKYFDNERTIEFKFTNPDSHHNQDNKKAKNEMNILFGSAEPLKYIKNKEYFELFKLSLCLNLEMIIKDDDSIEQESKTDKAFYDLMRWFGIKLFPIKKIYTVDRLSKSIPFSSSRKRMSTIIQGSEFKATGYRMFIKGGSEIILNCVDNYIHPDTCNVVKFTDSKNDVYKEEMQKFNNESLRTIAIAYKDITKDQFENYESTSRDHEGVYEFEKSGFTLIGMAGIKDTLKQGVPLAVIDCNNAGINVIMVTGDNIATAIAIAKESNILPKTYKYNSKNKEDYTVLSGPEFWDKVGGLICINCKEREDKERREGKVVVELSNKEQCACPKNKREAKKKGIDESLVRKETIGNKEKFREIVKVLRVVARSRPLDKYLLVFGLKEEDNIVAVTGDGTNDAPALSKASVGFAMEAGTDIAKNASDIIIVDNNFASIVIAVLWGRNIYDSIRKFIQFQLIVNITACCLVFITACIGNESPLSAIQMLWVNLIMDSLGSLALATENPDKKLLKRKPYGKSEYIINWLMWKHILVQSMFLLTILLILYTSASKFISETMPYKVAESRIIMDCYGVFPGGGYDKTTDSFKIIDGSSVNWPSNILLQDNKGPNECGIYAKYPDLNQAFKIFESTYGNSTHMTIVYNVFVFYILFNQICARFIEDELNIFHRVILNPLFILITLIEIGLQVILIQFGSIAFHTSKQGLTIEQWFISIGFAAISFIVNFTIKLIPIEKCLRGFFYMVKRKKEADPDNDKVKDMEMNVKPNVMMNELGADNLDNSKQMEKKNPSKMNAINDFLRKPSNSLTRVGSKAMRGNKEAEG